MASASTAQKPLDRQLKKRPFAWMKKLAHLGSSPNKSKKSASKNEQSAQPDSQPDGFASGRGSTDPSRSKTHIEYREPAESRNFTQTNGHDPHAVASSNRSTAPTLGTNPDTLNSDGGQSKAATAGTANTATTTGGVSTTSAGGGNSVFSSSNHSSGSLTTTLTTIQSSTTAGQLNAGGANAEANTPTQGHQTHPSQSSSYFSHQYPTTPASAVPPHLQPHTHVPTTYRSATANNLLTDNASILTLASSSNTGRRRGSLDTDASVRAIPPSSNWGGSRESLPLSVLSQHTTNEGLAQTPGAASVASGMYTAQHWPSVGGLASTERASVYSSSGVTAPALNSERNSYHAGRSGPGTDGASVRSGLLGHGRQDSVGALVNSTPTSPRDKDGEE